VIAFTSFGRVRLKGVLAIVFEPESGCVPDLATLVLKPRDSDSIEFRASAAVKLGHKDLLLRNGIAERSCNCFFEEAGQNVDCACLLISEGIFVLVNKDIVDELVVGHGRVIKNLVLMLQVHNILRLEVAQRNEVLAVIASKAEVGNVSTSTPIKNPTAFDRAIAAIYLNVEVRDVDPQIRE